MVDSPIKKNDILLRQYFTLKIITRIRYFTSMIIVHGSVSGLNLGEAEEIAVRDGRLPHKKDGKLLRKSFTFKTITRIPYYD